MVEKVNNYGMPEMQITNGKGMLGSHGQLWAQNKGNLRILPKWLQAGAKTVFTYRCPNCKKIELESEE